MKPLSSFVFLRERAFSRYYVLFISSKLLLEIIQYTDIGCVIYTHKHIGHKKRIQLYWLCSTEYFRQIIFRTDCHSNWNNNGIGNDICKLGVHVSCGLILVTICYSRLDMKPYWVNFVCRTEQSLRTAKLIIETLYNVLLYIGKII